MSTLLKLYGYANILFIEKNKSTFIFIQTTENIKHKSKPKTTNEPVKQQTNKIINHTKKHKLQIKTTIHFHIYLVCFDTQYQHQMLT